MGESYHEMSLASYCHGLNKPPAHPVDRCGHAALFACPCHCTINGIDFGRGAAAQVLEHG